MTRAAIYARYSTDNQSPRSVADQIALCEAHADRLGHVVVERYSDAATSGQIINRPGFSALMKAARLPPETRPFDVLIVESADRLSRHAGDIHHIRDAFAFAEVPVLQVEGGELDAMKAAVSGLVSSLSIKSTIEKTIRGMSAKAHDGLRMGGRLYGYRPVKGEPGVVEIDEAQAEVVRRIFAMHLSGDSYRTIAQRLTTEGIPGPRGIRWTASAIGGWGERGNGILGNEAYRGVMIWGKVKMYRDPDTRRRVSRGQPAQQWIRVDRPELAIIDQATFEAAQARRAGKRKPYRKGSHLLTGLLRCPCCGGGMSIKDGKADLRRVVCTNRANSRTCAAAQTYYVSRIERAVVDRLRLELEQPEGLALYVSTFNAERQRLARDARLSGSANRAELARVEESLHRAAQAVISGTMGHSTAKPHIARLEARKSELVALVAAAEAAERPAFLFSGAVARFREQLADMAANIPEAARRGHGGPLSAFRRLVASITVHPNYELEIAGDLAPLLGVSMVAGDRLERNPQTPPASIPFIIKAAA